MIKLTAEDLLELEYGDYVYRRNGSYCTHFRYVGRMPSHHMYLIFSAGEKIVHLYIRNDGTFNGEWFGGEYDHKMIIKLQIKDLQKELKSLKEALKRK